MFSEDQQFGLYTLIKRLGKGAFGEVWLAQNRTDAAAIPVAIKFPKSEDIDWQAVVQEIGLWVLCGNHPNVLPLIEARNYNGQIAIISEYAPDGSLRDLIRNQSALPHKQTIEMMIGVLDGLAHLHSNGIIHRDLKPENILLQSNTPRLADFGISRVMTTNSLSQTVSGTPFYMAPEAFKYKRNEQTDVWSIGVILYELLKGSLPFPQRDLPSLYEAILERGPEPLPASIPTRLHEIVLKALSRKTEARYQTAAEMLQALQDYYQFHTVTIIEDIQLIPYRKGDKWGFCNSGKNLVITPKYDWVYFFSKGLAFVILNDKEGLIDKTGREVFMTTKYSINYYCDEDHALHYFREDVLGVKLNGKYGFVDIIGREVVPVKYDSLAHSFTEGVCCAELNGKWGFIDKNGKEVIPIKYDRVGCFREGLAWVELNGKYGFIDKTGKEVIPFIYDIVRSFSEGLAWVTIKGTWSFINRAGQEVTEIKYTVEPYSSFKEGLSIMFFGNNKWGFIDKTGREVISVKYDRVDTFRDGLARVKLNDNFGFIDKTGQEVIPIRYQRIEYFKEGLAHVKFSNKEGYIDKTGREVIPIRYDRVEFFSEGLAAANLNDKYGFIDKTGREVIPIRYDLAHYFSGGLSYVQLNGNAGYIGRDGTEYFED
jgi:hypothetical protein